MPVSTTTPNPFNRSQQESFTVVLKDRDGVVDDLTPITWTTDDATIVDVKVDASADPLGRNPLLVGKGPTMGSVFVRGTAAYSAAQGGPVTVNINCGPIADTPVQSIILCTFGSPQPKS